MLIYDSDDENETVSRKGEQDFSTLAKSVNSDKNRAPSNGPLKMET